MVNSSKKSFLIYTHTTRKQGIKSPHSKPSQYPESVANPTYKPTSTHLQKGDNFCTYSIAAFLTFTFCDTHLENFSAFCSVRYGDKSFRHFWRYLMGTHYLCNLTGHSADLDILYSNYGNLNQADFHSTLLRNQIRG